MLAGLLFVCFFLLAQACTNTSTLYDESYAACIVSPKCMDAFSLSPSHSSWERGRFNTQLRILLTKVEVLDWTIICNSTDTFDVWMVMISWWDFCMKNEVFSELTGDCVCRRDKSCDQSLGGTVGFATGSEWILLIILSIAFFYFTPGFFTKITALELLIHNESQGKPLSKAGFPNDATEKTTAKPRVPLK
jgi:hypothetical protein